MLRVLPRPIFLLPLFVATVLSSNAQFQKEPTAAVKKRIDRAMATHSPQDRLGALIAVRKVAEATGDANGVAAIDLYCGRTADEMGQSTRAAAFYLKGAQEFAAQSDLGMQGASLHAAGQDFSLLGQREKALEVFDQALTAEAKANDPLGTASTYAAIARVDDDLGRMQTAMDYVERSLADFDKAIPNLSGEDASLARAEKAITLNYKGMLLDELGDRPRALAAFQVALPLFKQVSDARGLAQTYTNMGSAYDKSGNHSQALAMFNQALPLWPSAELAGRASTLNHIGVVHKELGVSGPSPGEFSTALDYYNQALSLYRQSRDVQGQALELNNIGRVYVEQKNYDLAMQMYQQALALEDVQEGAKLDEAVTLKNCALAIRKRGDIPLAITLAKESVATYERVRAQNRELAAPLRRSYAKEIEPTYRLLADLLIQEGRIAEAESVMGLLKDEESFQFSGATLRGAIEDSVKQVGAEQEWWTKWQQLQANALPTLRAYNDLRQKVDGLELEGKPVSADDRAKLSELEKSKSAVDQATNAYLSSIAQESEKQKTAIARPSKAEFEAFATRNGRDIVADLQHLQRSSGVTAAVYGIVSDDETIFLVATPSGIAPVSAPIGADSVNGLVAAFREQLINPRVDPRAKAQELYSRVFEPVFRQLGDGPTHVMWCLDGLLRYVPIVALSPDGTHYVVESSVVHSMFEPREVARIMENPSPSEQIAAFAATAGKPPKYPPLKGAGEEVHLLVNTSGTSGVLPGMVFEDRLFTKAKLKAALDKEDLSVLHVASHFALGQTLSDSDLLLGDGEELPLNEFASWNSQFGHIDLMTLSACNTAETMRGDATGGQLESFAGLAMDGGARAVLATLWPAADDSTPLLMKAFYENWRNNPKLGKGEALHKAQQDMLTGKNGGARSTGTRALPGGSEAASGPPFVEPPGAPFAHPFYWAPFLLFGNWQ